MKRIVVLVALAAAACSDSTTSLPDVDGGDISTVDTAAPLDDAITVGSDEVDPQPTDPPPGSSPAAEPPDTIPLATDPPATDPPATDPPATDPSATDPPATDPPATAPLDETPVAFDGVANVYGGTGRDGQPWIPLGWWDGSAWNDAGFDEQGTFVEVPMPGVSSLSATSLDLGDGPESVVRGLTPGAQQEYCIGQETGPLIDLPVVVPDTDVSLGYDVVAVSADWPLQPRPVRQVGIDVEEYVTVGARLFPSVPDAATTGEVVQVVRVDLDGDSIEEVLVTFEHITEDFGAEGDFTGVYARYPSPDGTLVDDLVAAYVPDAPLDFPTIGRFTIAAVADLNGDSVMEVVLRDMFWESAGMAVFALEDGRLVQVAGGGCGL